MAAFLELGTQNRKEDEARSAARCHGDCSLARRLLLLDGQEASGNQGSTW